MDFSNTTASSEFPLNPSGLPVLYVLLSLSGLCVITGLAVLVVYVRRRKRLDELRHKLIPLYTYDPSEHELDSEGGWGDEGRDEEKELSVPLCKDGKLTFNRDL